MRAFRRACRSLLQLLALTCPASSSSGRCGQPFKILEVIVRVGLRKVYIWNARGQNLLLTGIIILPLRHGLCDVKDLVDIFGNRGAFLVVDVNMFFVRHVLAAERITELVVVGSNLKSVPRNGSIVSFQWRSACGPE